MTTEIITPENMTIKTQKTYNVNFGSQYTSCNSASLKIYRIDSTCSIGPIIAEPCLVSTPAGLSYGLAINGDVRLYASRNARNKAFNRIATTC